MSSPIEKSGDVKRWMKRKRTQRHCNINSISQPLPPAPVITSSPSSSVDFSGVATEEEEIDLAHSLILLSRGGNLKDQAAAMQSDTPTSPPPPPIKIEKVEKTERTDNSMTSRRLPEATVQTNGNDYPCKTCNKRFNSFQALGGHRASHKKPKLGSDEQKVQSPTDTGTTSGVILKLDDISNYNDEILVNSPVVKPPVPTVSGKVRVHECQICHAEFNTGQALGGHMRRHKPLNGGVDSSKNKKDRSGLQLDLNFPPSDQEETTVQQPPTVFPFKADPPTQLLLGSSALTNCLY